MLHRSLFMLAAGLLLGSVARAQNGPIKVLPIETTKLADGFSFTEGPVWNPRGFFLFSDIPVSTLFKITMDGQRFVIRKPTGRSNGNAYDAQGRLVSCEQDRRVSRKLPNGTFETLADSFEGKKLNSPNDLAIFPDGSIYFTDPTYGIKADQSELGFRGLFRLMSDGKLELLDREWQQPNGVCFSPDFKRLYVNDSQASQLWVYDVSASGELSAKTLLDDIPKEGGPDGMKCDKAGRLFVTAEAGVRVYSPEGALLGLIAVPKPPANVAFGGEDGGTLFITARDSVYTARPTF